MTGKLGQYVVGGDALAAIRCMADGMNGSKRGTAISIIGPYGSGKSTLGLFMNRLAGPGTECRKAIDIVRTQSGNAADAFLEGRNRLGVDDDGMIRCRVMARREPIHVTITQGDRERRSWNILASMVQGRLTGRLS